MSQKLLTSHIGQPAGTITGQIPVSIIITAIENMQGLDRLLSTFFAINTHRPVELIIVDRFFTENIDEIINRYAADMFIRLIKSTPDHSFAAAHNYAATKSRYPFLLFLDCNIIYNLDILPEALESLYQPDIGVVGILLEDVSDSASVIQYASIDLVGNEAYDCFQPRQLRYACDKNLLIESEAYSAYPLAVSSAFLLCRKADFDCLQGFNQEYSDGLEDVDLCLQLRKDLKKKCYFINTKGLQYSAYGPTRLNDLAVESEMFERNQFFFNGTWNAYIRKLKECMQEKKGLCQSAVMPSIQIQPIGLSEFSTALQMPLRGAFHPTSLNILFALPGSIESNNGYQIQVLSHILQTQAVEAIIALPHVELNRQNSHIKIMSYDLVIESDLSLIFSNGRPPDLIHAWTPRENVRRFCEKLLSRNSCPLIIHMEDNEEYLTEVATGRSFADLLSLSETELDQVIPDTSYHPIKGRSFMDMAQGLTLIIETLNHFNTQKVSSLVLLPPADERLFYPRPLNLALRRELGIPDTYIVLAYTGNIHSGNQNEVLELYRAVELLNHQDCSAVLLRTGQNDGNSGIDFMNNQYVRHLGWVERERIPQVLAAADILVQPGLPGPFNDQRIPCKLPEYFAMGKPVVLPKTNLGLQVTHGKEGFVLEKANAAEIVRAVMEINNNPEFVDTLRFGARNFYCLKLAASINNSYSFFYQLAWPGLFPTSRDYEYLKTENEILMQQLIEVENELKRYGSTRQ